MSKKKLVIIGASELQLPLIKKAKERGYETHVFAWKCGDIGEDIADVFYPISITEKDEILSICKIIKPDGIVTIASDLAVITVNYVADKMNLIGNPIGDTIVTTNKFYMRERLNENNIECPKYMKVSGDNITLNINYPVIVKPTDRSGSRGICKVNNTKDLKAAIKNAINQSFSKEAIIEEFIEGKEYSVEFISQNGNHKFLAITEKVTTGNPNFIEIGHIQYKNIVNEKLLAKIKNVVKCGLEALNIRNGASHSEIMITSDEKVYIIEIGARMGGDCIGSDLVEISTGFDFVNAVIDVSIGKEMKKIEVNDNNIGVVRYIFNQKDRDILNNIIENNSEYLYRVSEIQDIDNRVINDSAKRYGFYILKLNNKSIINEIFYDR